jgi:Fibronectin type III domain/Calcineurin-like phosphoesterase
VGEGASVGESDARNWRGDRRGRRARVRRRILPLASAAAVVLGLLIGSAGAVGEVLSDGFESGNLSQWTASSGMTVQQQITYAGSFAARATSSGLPAYAYKNLSTPLSELYYDGRFQVVSQGPTNVSLARFKTATGSSIFSIFRLSNGNLSYNNALTGVTTPGPLVTTGTWHELEVHALINGNSSLVEVWLDGTKVITKSAEGLGTTGVGRIYIGDNSTGRAFDFVFDNQIVSTSDVGQSPPSNTSLPTISGTAAAGQTLSADSGQWSGTSPISYAFQWQSCDQSGNACTNIAGATSQTYLLGQADIGTTLRVVVTGSNSYGSASATSNATAVVIDPGPIPPSNSSLPTISGTTQMGQTLTADPGQWSGSQPISFAYQWRSCDQTGANCVDILGATSQTYTLTLLDLGTTVRVAVTASNSVGSSTATSAQTAIVVDSPPPIFSDDFETGNLSKWTSVSGMTVQQQVTYAGSWAARATSTGGNGYAYKTFSSTLAELDYDGRFDAISQGISNVSMLRFKTASGGSILSIFRLGNGRLSYSNGITGVSTTGPQVSTGTWHELEVHALINGNSSLIEVWLDGTPVISMTDNLGTTPIGRLYLGDSSGRTFDFAFDNEVVSGAGDVTPPTTPTGLAANPIGSNRLNLTWNASTDNNNQLAGYTLYRNGNPVVTVGPNTLGYADTGLSPNTSYSYTIDAFDSDGNRSARSSAVSGTTGSASSGDPVIAAAGDIACGPGDSRWNGGAGTPGACQELATSNILFGSDLAAVLPLGDEQYEDGTLPAFMQSYDPSWGRVNGLSHPVPGNHEYQSQGAAGYYSYFGSLAGDPTKGYYSFDIGAWHLIALNSECANIGGCGTGSPEEVWLRNDLAAHSNTCTLAYWHRPRFSSGFNGGNSAFAAWWSDLYNANADIVLNGHDHDYERFAPQDPSQNPDPNGIREFVAGTGGQEHMAFVNPSRNSQIFNNNTFGVLKLTLHPTSYDWQFVPQAGGTFTDSGTGSCH